MSSGVFFLDEDRDRDSGSDPSSSPRDSPTLGAESSRSGVAADLLAPPVVQSTLQIPTSSTTPILSPTPTPASGQAYPQHRKHAIPFAATPSFPSPLAQAITVPLNSDTSSSSSHSSPTNSDDENGMKHRVISEQYSPTISGGSGTPRRSMEQLSRPRTVSPVAGASRSSSPKIQQLSRPPSPNTSARPQIMTPSTLLMRNKRSGSGSALAGNLPPPTTKPSPPRSTKKDSPTHPASRRFESITRAQASETSSSSSRERSGSSASFTDVGGAASTSGAGDSPLISGSPELEAVLGSDNSAQRRAIAIPSPINEVSKGSNILGLGWGANWDNTSVSGSSLGSGSGSLKDKGRSKEVMGPPSPRRERERTAPVGLVSPSRQRRPSEFLNPSSVETRQMPVIRSGRNSFGSQAVASLSTSASMISPLNPLPSPWGSTTDGSTVYTPSTSATSENSSATTASSSGAGAMRLNRVPTSVRLAAELLKGPTATPPRNPSPPSDTSTASVPTPNPSPEALTPGIGIMGPPASRQISHFPSMPPPAPRVPATSPQELGNGRPTLSVPSTPAGDRSSSPINEKVVPSTAPMPKSEFSRSSSGNLAPPTSFKSPLPPALPRPRPSLPVEAGLGETFSSGTKHHRYRTSMHEAFKPSLSSNLADLTLEIPSSGPAEVSSDVSISPHTTPFGLGLSMPPAAAIHIPKTNVGSGSVTPGIIPAAPSRVRATTEQGIAMDLAGFPGHGDAASHASMIMQSRQAKLQRWRPTSSGSIHDRGEGLLPPAFNRSTTTGAPAMLAGPRADRGAQWGLNPSPTAASSPGEDLPPIPSAMHELSRAVTLSSDLVSPRIVDRTSGPGPAHSNAGPSRFIAGSSSGMERQASASGTVGGIEWVDWMDCYKRYKEEKIRAEATAARGAPGVEGHADQRVGVRTPIPEEPTRVSQDLDITPTPNYDAASAIALSPTTSRDDFAPPVFHQGSMRRRSLSIRSSLSLIDPKLSPLQKRSSIFERPRQTSGSSTKTEASLSSGNGVKAKKKNLVYKMEGWWNAVKSNFVPDSQHSLSRRSSNSGQHGSGRIPSAPTSRRVSEIPPIPVPVAALLAPAPVRRDSGGMSLRQATSHAELRSRLADFDARSLHDTSALSASTSADISRLSRQSSSETAIPAHPPAHPIRQPSTVPEEPFAWGSRAPSSLETRRRQPNLRLELESNVLTQPNSRNSESGGSSGPRMVPLGASAFDRPSQATSRSSSYGQSLGPGLTPGVPRWDQTPSPIYALGTGQEDDRDSKENKPVAPGADITVASVRRHVRHRLTAAKEACDTTMKKAIEAITSYVEKQRQEEQVEEIMPTDYFASLNLHDSPLIDGEETESEAGGERMEMEGPRSRAVSSSRGPSRRPSVSHPSVSPTKRTTMLPSSPNRISGRRRPSAAPRNYMRPGRNMSLALDQTASGSSSRSTSRSRSPMPPRNRASSQTQEVDSDRLFLEALQDLIVLATEVLDSSVNAIVSNSNMCAECIQKLQKVGQTWDDHEDWPGRDWYVDILMAVANLSRVIDWWEAEKGFWNFDEEDENEPLLFVVKPSREEQQRFDQEFKAVLNDQRHSPAAVTLSVPDQPHSANSLDAPSPDTSGPYTAKTATGPLAGTPKAQAVDDLRFLADHAKSVNIVMELSLHGEHIEYVNDAIMEVIGRDPEDVLEHPITDLLAPADASVFAEATQQLVQDDGNTVQLRFRFEVHDFEDDEQDDRQPGPVYIELEAVGMLMRENNEPSHTMWVLKPVAATKAEEITEAAFPRDGIISNEGILCRICEREIVTWFFEKHNETCDAVHRLEAEIMASNECMHDLQQTVVKLNAEIDVAAPNNPAQYQGVLFFTLPDSIASVDEGAMISVPQGIEVRGVAHEHLLDVINVLKEAREIETPSVQEDEADLPFKMQMYLSPESEEKLLRIRRWQRPQTSDRALNLLFTHVEDQLRRKQKAIARMQSTIRYSEKTRHEWEDKVNQILAERDEGSPSDDSGSEGAGGASSPVELQSTPLPDAPETSPPGMRKIAPQARLPITQSHPHRPPGTQTEISGLSTLMPTPALARTPAAPVTPAFPPAAVASPVTTLAKPDSKPSSPLLVPSDIKHGHHRRVSTSRAFRDGPLSPRIPSAALPARAAQPSIKDFEIIKPISRGAFGSVYLAKKVATGDYFAIKALKKSDMIAKNQITNVKAERTILMNQASSPYVAKLFFSFQSKDYLYLVMEYLNGGDCATLVKTLGGLSEDWARNYTAEVVLGLEYLHVRNIVHRDIKPDNLLIDARGHLKLTDFGLSRIGLLNRQVGGPRPAYLRGTSLRGSSRPRPSLARTISNSSSNDSPLMSPELLAAAPSSNLSQSYFAHSLDMTSADDSSGSESVGLMIPKHLSQLSPVPKMSGDMIAPPVSGREVPKFVGTPDYLAPESILGIGQDDKAVDWWALGVVLYEFLYGIPPFHAETPEKVFDNIVSRRIDWHEDEVDVSPEAKDLMNRLMCSDPIQRLGARGADEVKRHAFFAHIDWNTIATQEASFVPEVTDPESTDYFDSRGASHTFHDEDAMPQVHKNKHNKTGSDQGPLSPTAVTDMSAVVDDTTEQDDFGTFNFKNLPVLKQANDDVIRKMRTDSMAPIGQTLESPAQVHRTRPRSLSTKLRDQAVRNQSDIQPSMGPPSPTTSTSSAASTPSRASIPPTTPGMMPTLPVHFRRPSELNALDRVKSTDESDMSRRNSAPIRIRAGSNSSAGSTSMELWRQRRQVSLNAEVGSLPSSAGPLDSPESNSRQSSGSMPDRSLDVLIAEDNPISQKILETLLTRMGCRCICVDDGPAALAATMGSIRFDVIICDIHMPVVNGEQVARMIRSTNNHNQNTPIIAATSYEQHQSITEEGTLFSAVLAKPVLKQDLIKCLGKLGFILSAGVGVTAGTSDSSSGSQSQSHSHS